MTASGTTSSTSCPAASPRVVFVGAGPGDPGLLTIRGREVLAAADIVVVDAIARTDMIARYVSADATVIDASHGGDGQEHTVASRAKLVAKAARELPEGGLLVRLVDGDPSTFSGVPEEARALRKAGISFDVVPGVTAVTAVPTYAGIPLTSTASGTVSTSVHVVSAESVTRWDAMTHSDTTVIVLGEPHLLGRALGDLLAAGRDASTPVALTERGTTNEQRTIVTTLGEAQQRTSELSLLYPSMGIVSSTVALRDELSWYENKALYGWRVLVPRTQAQAGPTVSRLATYGATADIVPTISVEPPRTPHQMERAVQGLVNGRYEWIGFTSVNAVKAVRERFDELGLDCRAFAGLKVAAVGGVTANALRSWGINPDLVPSGEQSAAGLLEDWPEYDDLLDPINRVFLPRADIATDTLVAGLKEMGWEVDDVTAYRTVRAAPPPAETRDGIKTGAFDAVLFTSSSTVRNLVGIAGKPHASTVIACIGPATAKTAQELGLRVDVLAPEATTASLVDALAAHGLGLAAAAIEAGEPVTRPGARRGANRRATRRKAR